MYLQRTYPDGMVSVMWFSYEYARWLMQYDYVLHQFDVVEFDRCSE